MVTNQPPVNPAPSFPLFGILGLIFIVLKLCGTIDWSWWWVLAPFWGVFLGYVFLLGAVVAIPFVVLMFSMAGLYITKLLEPKDKNEK